MNREELKHNRRYCLHMNMRKATRAIAGYYESAMRSTALERTQFTLLSVIDGVKQVTISGLAQVLVMDQTTVTRNIKVLQRKGFVQIERGEDRRTRLISLTDEGKRALSEAIPYREQAQSEIIDELGAEKTSELLSLLEQLIAITSKS